MFANASTRKGPVTPDSTLTVTGATFLSGISMNSAGNGYLVDRNANAIYGYDNIAARNGAIAPDRTLTGSNTLLARPSAVFEHE